MPNVEGKSGAIPVLPASALVAPPTYDAVQPTNNGRTWNVAAQHDIAQPAHAPAIDSFGVDGLASPATHTTSKAPEAELPGPIPVPFTSADHPPPTNPTFTQPLPPYVAQASPYYVPYNTSPAQDACCVSQEPCTSLPYCAQPHDARSSWRSRRRRRLTAAVILAVLVVVCIVIVLVVNFT